MHALELQLDHLLDGEAALQLGLCALPGRDAVLELRDALRMPHEGGSEPQLLPWEPKEQRPQGFMGAVLAEEENNSASQGRWGRGAAPPGRKLRCCHRRQEGAWASCAGLSLGFRSSPPRPPYRQEGDPQRGKAVITKA